MTVRLPGKEITLDESNDFRLQIADWKFQIGCCVSFPLAIPLPLLPPLHLCPCAPVPQRLL